MIICKIVRIVFFANKLLMMMIFHAANYYKDTKPYMSSLLVFKLKGIFRLKI
jgi:hypothetical protein